jgi:hypothetical protein
MIAPVCYINKPLDPNMKCAMHNRGCGAYLQVGNICYIDGSECTFIEGHYFISVRLLNHLGLRTCKVGYVKVLCNQVHLLCNRIGVVSSMFAKHDNKVFECTKYTEKEVTLPCDEEVKEDSVTVVLGLNNNVAKNAKKKEKKSKAPTKNRPNHLGQFHANMKDALAKISDQTLHVVHEAFGVANLTMLDGGYPGSQPISSAEFEVQPAPDTDGDDEDHEDDASWREGKERGNKKKRKRNISKLQKKGSGKS